MFWIIGHKLNLLRSSSSLVLIFLLVGSVSGVELGVSPPSSEFELDIGEKGCVDYRVYSDRDIEIYLEDYWSEGESKELEDYVYSAGKYNLDINYQNVFSVGGFYEGKLCIVPAEEGVFNGVLLFRESKRRLGVGMWIKVSSGSEISKITGRTIEDSFGDFDFMSFLVLFQVFLLVLFLALFLTLLHKRKILTK